MEKKRGYLTDENGKPSESRWKSRVMFICAILIMALTLVIWGLGDKTTLNDFQVPLFFFTICLGGGISIQVAGKFLETMSNRKL